ncbi:MAG: DUF1460 domain-containing protein [Ignavibacteria bacterium]|nr:DUF1460 domain-containing protein [Ignavibacteria bacterium]
MNRRNFLKSSIFLSAALVVPKFNFFPENNRLLDEIELVRAKLDYYENICKDLTLSDLISFVGNDFLGAPYEGGSLDFNVDVEELVIRISSFDCVTFVENVLNFSRLLFMNKTTTDDFISELTKIRYRNGVITDYTSRLHYFSDWIFDNEKKGIVKDITQDIGGIVYDKEINFMTNHLDSYKQLKNNKSLVKKMYEIEDNISLRKKYYLKRYGLKQNQSKIQTGDILALTTDIAGLDVSHTGLALNDNGRILFLHASQKAGKVIVSNEGLLGYINSIKKCTGVMVARPV